MTVVAGNAGAGGPFAPLVVVTRNIMGTKEFNQFRGKMISLHSQGAGGGGLVRRSCGRRESRVRRPAQPVLRACATHQPPKRPAPALYGPRCRACGAGWAIAAAEDRQQLPLGYRVYHPHGCLGLSLTPFAFPGSPPPTAVIKDFCKQLGADTKQVQGLIRLAKKNGEKLGFLA